MNYSGTRRGRGAFWFGATVALATMLAASEAHAQYAENTAQACQDRVDNDADGYADCADQDCGAFVFCVNAGAQATVVAPGVPTGRHWALGGAVVGFSAAPIVLGLAVGAEVTNGPTHGDIAEILGGIALGLGIATIPIAAGGAASVRRAAGVRGCLGCRIAGWISYGLAIADGITLLALGLGPDIAAPTFLITAVGLLAATSAVLMAGDALVGRRQAAARGVATAPRGRWTVAPFLAPVTDDTGLGGAVAGLSIVNL